MSDDVNRTTAERLYRNLVIAQGFGGACYNLSIFLKLFLEGEMNIATEMVLGFVTDGGDVYAPHAWVEHCDRRTDVAVLPLDSSGMAVGTAYVLNDVLAPGATWSYHRNRPMGALENPEAEGHRQLVAGLLEMGHDGMRLYMQQSPVSYDEMVRIAVG